MPDFRNTNTLWASIIVETLFHLGLKTAVICPGSRSTPLTVAFAQHPSIRTIPILDERSAAFFALGSAKRLKMPVALVCTSGTAAANFYGAVIEAQESYIPLLILTADRPPELRNCRSGQTIDQIKLYGNYPNWQTELATPSTDIKLWCYLRQTVIYAWERTLFPIGGVVHLNIPFADPLAPIPQNATLELANLSIWQDFFQGIEITPSELAIPTIPSCPFDQWQSTSYGIIIAGVADSPQPESYCRAIARLSQFLQYPVLAEALSPLRNYAGINPYLICTYDLILRRQDLLPRLTPKIIIQLGELPTSKQLRSWLDTLTCQRWIISPKLDNFDALHGASLHLRTSVEQLVTHLDYRESLDLQITSEYLKDWLHREQQLRVSLNNTFSTVTSLVEGKVMWLLSDCLPDSTSVFIANSMSVRYAEFFWQPNERQIIPYFNRGANGIDGTLSTALGVADESANNVMITGDLALLHDTNGFLIRDYFRGHLTIIVVNNNGGGIFETLPIAEFDPPFEEFFATPQNIDFAKLCATYNLEYHNVENWETLRALLNPLPNSGIRVLEIKTNRKQDTIWLKNLFNSLI